MSDLTKEEYLTMLEQTLKDVYLQGVIDASNVLTDTDISNEDKSRKVNSLPFYFKISHTAKTIVEYLYKNFP